MKANLILVFTAVFGLSTASSAPQKMGAVVSKKVTKKNVGDPAGCVLERLEDSGIGDVKFSILSESDFQAVNGVEWVQLKGQEVSQLDYGTHGSTSYDQETIETQITDTTSYYQSGSHLPDASGRFLRVKNMTAGAAGNPQNANPESVLLGQPQGFATARPQTPFTTTTDGDHTHKMAANASGDLTSAATLSASNHLVVQDGNNPTVAYDEKYALDGVGTAPTLGISSPGGAHNHRVEGGDNETRPVNVTVNTYVKIRRGCISKVITDKLLAVRCGPDDTVTFPNGCFVDSGSVADPHQKVDCLKAALDEWEAPTESKNWTSGCLQKVVGTAKKVLQDLGSSMHEDEEKWYRQIVKQYPYYYVTE